MAGAWRPAGAIPLLQTPFLADGSADYDSLARQVRFVLDAGAEAVGYPGFVSEWWKLTPEEILRAAAVIRAETVGRARLVLNVTAQSTYHAVREASAFAGIGADALMCLPPFVAPVGSGAVLTHLRAVLASAPMPHILQYSASITGLRLSAAEILRLREEFPHLCSIKIDYVPPGPMVTELAGAMPPGSFTYLIGYAGLRLADALRRGAHGLMGGAGHFPEDLAVWKALQSGAGGAIGLFHQLLPLLNMEMQTIETSIALHKRLLFERGVISTPHVRPPGYELDEAAVQEMREHMNRLAPSWQAGSRTGEGGRPAAQS